jgi:probable F420-dependent oxidoreductase
VFEPLALLAHIAAVTSRITLGTSVIILPLRDPFLLAKQIATLERLAPGRVILGVGAGWERAEFSAVGVPFTQRGAHTDEAVELIRRLHETGDGHFDGRFHRSAGGIFELRPTRPVPLLTGGMSDAALRRAARAADRWQSVYTTAGQFRERRKALSSLTADRPILAGAVLRPGPDADAAALAHEADELRAAGADHIAIHFGDLSVAPARMRAFAATSL